MRDWRTAEPEEVAQLPGDFSPFGKPEKPQATVIYVLPLSSVLESLQSLMSLQSFVWPLAFRLVRVFGLKPEGAKTLSQAEKSQSPFGW